MICNYPLWSIIPKAITDDSDFDFSTDSADAITPNGLAVINIIGSLDTDSYADLTSKINTAVANPLVSSILLYINSPGGQVLGLADFGNVISAASLIKPIFAFADSVVASAAYWIASCTNGIFVTPTTLIGSIGVLAIFEDVTAQLAQEGIKLNIFTGGKFKMFASPLKPLTAEESEIIQADIDDAYNEFTSLVDTNRGGVSMDNMQGQLFDGKEAVANNLADALVVSIDDVIAALDTPLQPQSLDTTPNSNN